MTHRIVCTMKGQPGAFIEKDPLNFESDDERAEIAGLSAMIVQ